MEEIIAWIKEIRLSDIADVLEVVGFVLTIYVLITIKKIKNYYVFKARVPDLLKKMSKHASQLSQYHKDFENSKPEILLEIGQAEVILNSLSKKVGKQVNSSIKEVTKQILYYKTYQEKSRAWDIYISLQKVHQEIINLQEDRKWESNNA